MQKDRPSGIENFKEFLRNNSGNLPQIRKYKNKIEIQVEIPPEKFVVENRNTKIDIQKSGYEKSDENL